MVCLSGKWGFNILLADLVEMKVRTALTGDLGRVNFKVAYLIFQIEGRHPEGIPYRCKTA